MLWPFAFWDAVALFASCCGQSLSLLLLADVPVGALAGVLVFVGVKMVAEYWTGHHVVTPVGSLAIILSLLGVSIVASVVAKRRETAAELGRSDTGY